MNEEFVEVFSSDEAREVAERHRQHLGETLDVLSERVGGAVENLERQVTFPLRWVLDHPLAAFGLSLSAGLLLGVNGRKPKRVRQSALARELEGAYLQGRRDESEQCPPRESRYWANVKLADGPDYAALLIDAAKPLLTHLTSGLAESFTKSARERNGA